MSEPESENRFSPGEIVQLKSGGPFMTVIGVSEHGARQGCGWFWSGRYQTGTFSSHQLSRPSDETAPAAASVKNRIAVP